jgi:putative hydrolase of HD superfamily
MDRGAEVKELTKFLFESGQLSRVKRSGFSLVGVTEPHSVAEHCQRAAVIGYFLAKLEKADQQKVTLMCLFNDIHETRIGDINKVGHRYLEVKAAESRAHKEQLEQLGEAGKELLAVMTEYQARSSKEAEVARDADLLENALEAREYITVGFKDAQNWLDNIAKIIKTESGKKLLKEIEKADPNDWWKDLKKIER